jgi:hypothetical protein
MSNIEKAKKEFLINEFCTSSIIAGLSTRNKRFPVYSNHTTDDEKYMLKSFIREFLKNIWNNHQINRKIDETLLLSYIEKLKTGIENKFSKFIHDGEFRYGISQKIINVFLKFLWVSGEIDVPPHAPYDGIIQGRLKGKKLEHWTEITDFSQYELFVNAAKAVAQDNDIAAWELIEWNKK